MANKKYEETDIQAIAVAIKEKTGSEEPLYVRDMASGVNEVYSKGYGDGKKAEYDAFWDAYQDYGERTLYAYAFHNDHWAGGKHWNTQTFKPKYDLIPTNADRMFGDLKGIPDLDEYLKELGVKIDFSKCTRITWTFQYCDFVRFSTLDCSNASQTYGIEGMCAYCTKLETIEKLIMSEEIKSTKSAFGQCTSLKNLTVEGVIPVSISFSVSPLSVASLKSIITHLKDYTGTSSEHAHTVTLKASAFEALEAAGFDDADYDWIYSTFGLDRDSAEMYFGTWAIVIDNLKWNLVKA